MTDFQIQMHVGGSEIFRSLDRRPSQPWEGSDLYCLVHSTTSLHWRRSSNNHDSDTQVYREPLVLPGDLDQTFTHLTRAALTSVISTTATEALPTLLCDKTVISTWRRLVCGVEGHISCGQASGRLP